MNKGLEALEKIKEALYLSLGDNCKEIDIVEKELKALEIIKKKKVDTAFLFEMWEDEEQDEEFILENYNFNYEPSLVQEEYNLLKKVLL